MCKRSSRLLLAGLCWLALGVLAASPASAQLAGTGRIDVEVSDSTGGRLPGVIVELTGMQQQTGFTDAEGLAHFINLTIGDYQVSVALDGFQSYRNESVVVETGATVELRVALNVAGIAEEVLVTAETPVVDTRKQTTGTNISYDELQSIPSARDPWVILQSVPSVVVDRVNVGGSESGQQSNYMGRGADTADNTWYLDGIPITDMGATGSSSFYYDFDMFDEMQVVTGGAEITNPTPGVQLNGVLKSGTNVPHGNVRGYLSKEGMQSKNLSAELAESIGGETGKGNRTAQYADYGFDVGGPIVKDRAWAWGLAARTDIRNITLSNTIDRTILKNMALKVTGQITDRIRGNFTYFGDTKVKIGRNAGPTRPPETTWDQDGPTKLYKGEGTFVLRDDLILTQRGGYLDGAFSLTPQGGLDASTYQDTSGVYHGSFVDYSSRRPQWTALADGNYFRGPNEVKFGYSWRRAVVESNSTWPGNGALTIHLDDEGTMLPIVFHDPERNVAGTWFSLYASDTIARDRWTFNFGVRYDRAAIGANEASAGASSLVPEYFPALTSPAVKNTHVFNSIVPRASVSYALGEERKTVLRGSYSQFAGQLGAVDAGFVAGTLYYSYAYFLAIDANGDNVPSRDELLLDLGPLGFYGFDPDNPDSTDSPNVVGSNIKVPRTHEVVFGIDREVMQDMGLSAALTYRRTNGTRWKPLIGIRQDDFEEVGRLTGTVPGGGTYDQAYFAPKASVTLPTGNGREDINRDGYHQRFWGFDINLRKRLSNRWMMRFGFSSNSHVEYFTDPSQSIEDPTPITSDPVGGRSWEGPLVDGGTVIVSAPGSGKSDIFLAVPKYQFTANGMYQGPWGINVAASLINRQGFPQPFNEGNTSVDDLATPLKNVMVFRDMGKNRLPAVTTMDIRVEKVLTFNETNIIFDADLFNIFNSSTVLGRQFDVTATGDTGSGKPLEIMNPRILRIGLRITF